MGATMRQITRANQNHRLCLDRPQDHRPPQPPATATDYGALVVVREVTGEQGSRERELLPPRLLGLGLGLGLLSVLLRAQQSDDELFFFVGTGVSCIMVWLAGCVLLVADTRKE